jgi:hypothetical protein
MTKIEWTRRGLLVPPGAGTTDYTHASHPCAMKLGADNFCLIFSMRDAQKRSHIFTQLCTVKAGEISLIGAANQALAPGRIGTFDSEGLLACAPVKIDEKKYYFYYSGWNNLTNNLWLCDTGLAIIDTDSLNFSRISEGPVMARDKYNPFFAAATSVLYEKGTFRSWYNSGLDWMREADGSFKPKYAIHYAESDNGIDWKFFNGQVIPFSDEHEHSFGRPCVVVWDNLYRMWFSCRGAKKDPEYRIGYAFSEDGLNWTRRDEECGITIAENRCDFDGSAQSYPYAFEHDEFRYLLYSGNSYGATGFGYAVSERKCVTCV